MHWHHERPLIIGDDMTVLLETEHELYEEAREVLSRFSDLVKSPGILQTYRITPVSLWNAAASGMKAEEIIRFLEKHAKSPPTLKMKREIQNIVERYGLFKLQNIEGRLVLTAENPDLLARLLSFPSLEKYKKNFLDDGSVMIPPQFRGTLKQEMLKLGYAVIDLAGYDHGESLGFSVQLKETTGEGKLFSLRDYQKAALDSFYCQGTIHGGHGIIVLPCGAGKTIVGLAALAQVGSAALILTPNATSVQQWKREIADKTNIPEHFVGEYHGGKKEVRPVTIATYQILTHRNRKEDQFPHMRIFNERDWGLIIYDEVHLLPAPVFRITADIQAKRRLGLTATLIREDSRESDVFSLIGPKRFDMAWKTLEYRGWIAPVQCYEVRVPMDEFTWRKYAFASKREKVRIAAENPAKIPVLEEILRMNRGLSTLILGQYIEQLEKIAGRLGIPLISGKTPQKERERLYREFRRGELSLLALSKVANFAVDLPEASVAIQISGSFGSRQEEAQRLGRIMRPKKEKSQKALFYTLVTERSCEQEFAAKRQLFLLEQGYPYQLLDFKTFGQKGEIFG